MTNVIITEKKDVATAMAAAMGWKQSGSCYAGIFQGKPVKVVWARGHLLSPQEPDEITPGLGWNNPELLEIIPRTVKLKPTEEPGVEYNRSLKFRLDVIREALKDATEVILATDSDREGEYIGWSILEFLGWNKNVRRCWLVAGMDAASMQKALGSLLPASDKKSLARAAEARGMCDWAYMYLVRQLTFYGRKGLLGSYLGHGQGRESVVSVGRVQTAALYMIYKREMEIRNFKPQAFYKITGDFAPADGLLNAEYKPRVTKELIDSAPPGVLWIPQGREDENKLDRPLFIDKTQVDAFRARLMENAAAAVVQSYSEGTKEQHPPITFDLVAAKSELSKVCKVTGNIAQAVIEDLYEQGFISYPRTAHGELPMSLYAPEERNSRLKAIGGIAELSAAAKKAMAIHDGNDSQYKPFKPKVFVTKKLEHFGLIPTEKVVTSTTLANIRPRKMTGNKVVHTSEHMQQAYVMIAQSYIRALLPPARLATQKISFRVPTKDLLGSPTSSFEATAERTIDPGWRGIMSQGNDKASNLPKLTNGQPAPLKKVYAEEGKTKAPSRYSESNFEKAMQSAAREVNDPELRKYLADSTNKPEGIGTPATRKEIVPTLTVRGYIKSDKSRTFFLDNKGEELINYLMKNEHHWMYRIDTTAEWEGRLADMTDFTDDAQAVAEQKRFVDSTFCDIERFIRDTNARYRGQEGSPRERGPSSVTPKMKDYIKNLAQRKGVKVDPAVYKDPSKAKAFLDEHAPRQEASVNGAPRSNAPSEPQIKLLEQIEKSLNVKASEDERTDRAKLSAFIEKHKKKLDNATLPSEKMISFAKSIAAKMPPDQQPNPDVFTSSAACRKFLDQHAKSHSNGKGR